MADVARVRAAVIISDTEAIAPAKVAWSAAEAAVAWFARIGIVFTIAGTIAHVFARSANIIPAEVAGPG